MIAHAAGYNLVQPAKLNIFGCIVISYFYNEPIAKKQKYKVPWNT
jgi:hypothetical protein